MDDLKEDSKTEEESAVMTPEDSQKATDELISKFLMEDQQQQILAEQEAEIHE